MLGFLRLPSFKMQDFFLNIFCAIILLYTIEITIINDLIIDTMPRFFPLPALDNSQYTSRKSGRDSH
jgi:hypothetical protein